MQIMYWPQGYGGRPLANVRVARNDGEVLASFDVAGDGYYTDIDVLKSGSCLERLCAFLKAATGEHTGYSITAR